MKRFHCKACGRVVRARKFPINIDTEYAPLPADRVGECDWHATRAKESHGAYVRRHRVPAPPAAPSKYRRAVAVKPTATPKPKGKGKQRQAHEDAA